MGQRTKLNAPRTRMKGVEVEWLAGRALSGSFGFGGLSGVAGSALDTSYNQLTVSKTRTAADHTAAKYFVPSLFQFGWEPPSLRSSGYLAR